MTPTDPYTSLWEKISSWLPSFRPAPIMAAASVALLLLVIGIYNIYTPHDPDGKKFAPLSFGIIARVPSGMVTKGKSPVYKEVEIQDGGALYSGDMFRVKFQIPTEAYVYLLALNSQGDLTKLFPGKSPGFVFKAKPGVPYFVPGDDRWFRLDDNIGRERLYLLVSPKAIEGIDQKVDQLKKPGAVELSNIFPGVKIQSFSFKHE